MMKALFHLTRSTTMSFDNLIGFKIFTAAIALIAKRLPFIGFPLLKLNYKWSSSFSKVLAVRQKKVTSGIFINTLTFFYLLRPIT